MTRRLQENYDSDKNVKEEWSTTFSNRQQLVRLWGEIGALQRFYNKNPLQAETCPVSHFLGRCSLADKFPGQYRRIYYFHAAGDFATYNEMSAAYFIVKFTYNKYEDSSAAYYSRHCLLLKTF